MLISIDDRERTTLELVWRRSDQLKASQIPISDLLELFGRIIIKMKKYHNLILYKKNKKYTAWLPRTTLWECMTYFIAIANYDRFNRFYLTLVRIQDLTYFYPRFDTSVPKILHICTQDFTHLYPRSDYRSWYKTMWLSCT